MATFDAKDLMQKAWATRRSSFDLPTREKHALMSTARDDLVKAVAICRTQTNDLELAEALHLQANLEHDLGRNDAALALWRESVDILRIADRPLELAHKLRHVGDLHRVCRRFAESDGFYQEAAVLYRKFDRPGSLHFANAIRPMALLKEQMGLTNASLDLWREARGLYLSINIDGLDTHSAVAECDRHIARLERQS